MYFDSLLEKKIYIYILGKRFHLTYLYLGILRKSISDIEHIISKGTEVVFLRRSFEICAKCSSKPS